MDMTHSSKIAWNLVKKLSGDPKEHKPPCKVTANQVATQLLTNGRTTNRYKDPNTRRRLDSETNHLGTPFTLKELHDGLNRLKNGKAAGVDDICSEQIKHLGQGAKNWILQFYNTCCKTCKIPKSWRKSKVIALLKPGKDPEDPSSYRPISLLCHFFKLYERLILARIEKNVDKHLIPQQGGFRPGKSCTGQVLALTEHIEEGFEEKLITGAAFVDLTAAYDTVRHKTLLRKLYDTLNDHHLGKVVYSLLQNRRFFVMLEGKVSRWRVQKNGLPQGSVLAPMLFNIYTNDQPTPTETKHFLYADDLAICAQGNSFEEVEEKLETVLKTMTAYYLQNSLRPNPSKTQVCAFHLRTKEAKRKLQIVWNGNTLEHTNQPIYLGVTLDRSLTYRQHCIKTRGKVTTRNSILRKLTGSKWGARPGVLRTTAQALCFSTAEYACPVWSRSAHTKQVDTALNETCRIVTGCMKPTPLSNLYRAAGFAEPSTRRGAAEHIEKIKQIADDRHALYKARTPRKRLKSRKSFLGTVKDEPPEYFPLPQVQWTGQTLDFKTWKTLNRIRTGVATVKSNMAKWGKINQDDVNCDCGETQNMEHLLTCRNCPHRCTLEDLWLANKDGTDVARYWAEIL